MGCPGNLDRPLPQGEREIGVRGNAMWEPSQRYPDPTVQVLDASFNQYRLATGIRRTALHRLPLVGRPGVFR